MKRGDIIIAAPPSPFNKPRPLLVIQEVLFENAETVVVAPITSDLAWSPIFRIPIHPSSGNGLRKPSEVMIDKLQTVYVDRIGGLIGEAEPEVLRKVNQALRTFLGL